MSPHRTGGPAYWASGGGVEGRCGPVRLREALALLAFLSAEGERLDRKGESTAARFCAELVLELGPAIATAAAWRRSSQGLSISRAG
jgi:hypothetical protein